MALLSGSGRYMDVGSDLLDFYVVRAGSCEARDNSLELVIKGDVAIDFGPRGLLRSKG
jgi:hypothetical protein